MLLDGAAVRLARALWSWPAVACWCWCRVLLQGADNVVCAWSCCRMPLQGAASGCCQSGVRPAGAGAGCCCSVLLQCRVLHRVLERRVRLGAGLLKWRVRFLWASLSGGVKGALDLPGKPTDQGAHTSKLPRCALVARFVRGRIFLFIFGGEDSIMQPAEKALQNIWQAMVVRKVCQPRS